MGNRVEDAQAGISAVARYQYDFDMGFRGTFFVQREQFFNQREGDALFQGFVFSFDLVLAVDIDALLGLSVSGRYCRSCHSAHSENARARVADKEHYCAVAFMIWWALVGDECCKQFGEIPADWQNVIATALRGANLDHHRSVIQVGKIKITRCEISNLIGP